MRRVEKDASIVSERFLSREYYTNMFRLNRPPRLPSLPHGWLWEAVLFPFLVTRAAWELVAYYASGNFLPNPSYAALAKRGYFLTRFFPIDIFARWDSRWYFSILKHGYQPSADLDAQYSNMAFFPLYPYLVKSVGWLGVPLPDGAYILLGILLSNLCFIAAAALLYRLSVKHLGQDERAARRTLGLLFVFPSGFYLASFYPESLFLFLTLAAFTLALEERWTWSMLCAALLMLTKPTAVAPIFALGWLYMERRGWRLKEVRASAAGFLLPPLALWMHFYGLYLKSGDPFAFFNAMRAWGGLQAGVLEFHIRTLSKPVLDVYKIDLALTLIFLLGSLYVLWKWPLKAYGVFALAMLLLPLATGLLVSISRYLLVNFPLFVLLGEKLERREGYDLARAIGFALQIVYFAGWVNYYWVA